MIFKRLITATILLCFILSGCGNEKKEISTGKTDNLEVNELSQPTDALQANDKQQDNVTQTVKPYIYTEYSLNLNITDPQSGFIIGSERIKYTNQTGVSLETLFLNIYHNAFREDTLEKPYTGAMEKSIFSQGVDYGYLNVTQVFSNKEDDIAYSQNGTVLCITPLEPLHPDDEIELTLQFEAYVPKMNYRSGSNENAVWVSNFVPTVAVYDQDGWHTDPYYPIGEPFYNEISIYRVTINTPEGYEVACSSTSVNTEKNGLRITTAKMSYLRDFAFSLSKNYKIVSTTIDGVDINLYYYSNLETPGDVLERVADSIVFCNSKIAVYTYTSLDIVECSLQPTMIFSDPTIIFCDTKILQTGNYYKSLIREVTNQWFYSITGGNRIKEPWICEGLPSFLTQRQWFITDDELKEFFANEYIELSDAVTKINRENGAVSRLRTDLSAYKDQTMFQTVQIRRARMMFYSLYLKIGTEKFDAFITLYYNKYKFRNANMDGLIEMAEEAAGEELDQFFNEWLDNDLMPDVENN